LRRGFLALALAAFAAGACAPTDAGTPTVNIRIHYSKFEPATITVPAGVPVTYVIRNDDPIDHEWIIGDDAVQQKHRTGTELLHPSIPTEVVIAALSTRTTVVTFARVGQLKYICHLPGHEAYGMVGVVTIR